MTNTLVFFPVTGTFVATAQPPVFGTSNLPDLQPIQALITFTPQTPEGQPLYVSNMVISTGVSADTAVLMTPLQARIYDGVLSTIDIVDTPGFQLLANPAFMNLPGSLTYRCTFDKVSYNSSSQVLAPFTFTAPTDATPVCITATATVLGLRAVIEYLPAPPAPQPEPIIVVPPPIKVASAR